MPYAFPPTEVVFNATSDSFKSPVWLYTAYTSFASDSISIVPPPIASIISKFV